MGLTLGAIDGGTEGVADGSMVRVGWLKVGAVGKVGASVGTTAGGAAEEETTLENTATVNLHTL